ncbi:uncharacterized protein BXZ73DRAFT_102497 [Epithele typhae]|uniref:uncharacterized protein n=1 Tax=Epithele typhae TaxID=378194 RepID=UPI0020087657|nr:uncharacterized protein BXZ73DRAFT_102497 [Epithele typhae]KAH9927989.1 hypothetical protein BXZ73DRAFT_102497 [Epithele typhae]
MLQKAHFVGNSVKSMMLSVDASLKKLRTHYIDIPYVHWWDWDTSVEEVMSGLHNLVVLPRRVRHPRLARVQSQPRDFERDIIPMARAEGLALAPWNTVLQAGRIRTDEEEGRRKMRGKKCRRRISSPGRVCA